MQTDIAAGKTAKPRGDGRGRATVGGKGAASRSVTTLHSIFAHAKPHGLIETNPAMGVRKFPEQCRTRGLSRQEIGELGAALREMADRSTRLGSRSCGCWCSAAFASTRRKGSGGNGCQTTAMSRSGTRILGISAPKIHGHLTNLCCDPRSSPIAGMPQDDC